MTSTVGNVTDEELVDGARFVEGERLPDEVGEGRLTDKAVVGVELHDVGRQQSVAETEGGGCERRQDARIDAVVVTVPISLSQPIRLLL